MLFIKESCKMIGREVHKNKSSNSDSLKSFLPLMIISMKKKQIYQLIPFRDTADQKILKSDQKRSTPGHTQSKVVVIDVIIPWWPFPCKKKLRFWLAFFQNIDNQRILQSNWTKHNCPHPTMIIILFQPTVSRSIK